MRQLLINIIKQFDKNIHPKRVEDVFIYLNSIVVVLGAIIGSVAIGVIGFMLIEDYNLRDAFYMTVITISTVGFSELHPLSQNGRLFTSFLIITNLGVFFYGVSNLAKFFVSAEAHKIFSDLFVGRKIDKMENHIIVCGYGRYGSSVVDNLLNQKIDVVLIEKDTEKVAEIRNHKIVTVLEGDATDELTLSEAGVDRARALITTMPVDASNVYTVLTARQLNKNLTIISRANTASSRPVMMRAGADHVLVPESIGGYYMSALVTKPDIVSVFSEFSGLETDSFRMAEVILTPLPDRLRGGTLKDLHLESACGVNVIGMKHKNEDFTVNPTLDTPIFEGDAVLVVGSKAQIELFQENTKEFELIE